MSGRGIIDRHDDGGVTVEVGMGRGLLAHIRIGLTSDARILVRAVTVMPDTWKAINDEEPTEANVASAYLREVPISKALAAAWGDRDFLQAARERRDPGPLVKEPFADGPPLGDPRVGRGSTFKPEVLARVARHYLTALQTNPRSAVKETQRLLRDDDTDFSVPQIRDRLRACYERGLLLKTDSPGKAGAIAGPDLAVFERKDNA